MLRPLFWPVLFLSLPCLRVAASSALRESESSNTSSPPHARQPPQTQPKYHAEPLGGASLWQIRSEPAPYVNIYTRGAKFASYSRYGHPRQCATTMTGAFRV
ncbi:hypothetical protein B0H11DRAFT_2025551 [Mycena galericulata]|nr:hypothetical protein B0H11DRAFT_2048402 [Mycena galericulata]KAJ7480272.1 hypothetical protein B0H11DRAFT_2025551 [Mycena galericulata]